jgi:putative glutamine amidotransferase
MMKKIVLLMFMSFLIFACSKEEKLKIAISKAKGSEHYENYSKWLSKVEPNAEYIDLYFIDRDEALKILRECDGLLLSGGPDLHPVYFGKESDSARCEIDLVRDTLELSLIKEAMAMNLPILGICRGEQILNVALGGSLIIDIPCDYPDAITHQTPNPDSCYHDINLVQGTYLQSISGVMQGEVNSNHHQAVDRLADGLVASAYSADGIIEAFEWHENNKKPFMLAVQWHPERLELSNPLSKPIAEAFLKASKEYDMKQK